MKRVALAIAAAPHTTPPGKRSRMKPRNRGRSAVAMVALILVISACATRSERDRSLSPLETSPDAPWGTASVDLRFYELRQSSKSELRNEMREIRAARGMPNYGDTQWQISTSYDFSTSGDVCEPTRVGVSLELRVTLPRLRDPDALSAELRADWRRFLRALRDHQANHKQIAIECAEQISAELRAAGLVRCNRLAEVMQSITEEVTSTCHARSADYDLRTRYGAAEGVRF
jgi:predicted secreted Zn-dependent protease